MTAEVVDAAADALRRSEPEQGEVFDQIPSPKAKPPEADEGGVLSAGETSDEFGRRQIIEYRNIQYFLGTVHSHGGTIGIAHGGIGPAESASPLSMGRVDEVSVRESRRGYSPPAGYDAAREALDRDRVVILEGRRGVGKQFGAVSLLCDCTDGPVRRLSPMMSVQELAGHPFGREHGYVVDFRGRPWAADSGFSWDAVRDAVRSAAAWLVVICESGPIGMLETITRTSWTAPDPRRFLELNSSLAADKIDHGLRGRDAETATFSMTDWKQVADRTNRGMDLGQAIAEQAGSAARDAVRAWFDGKCSSWDALAEITTLLFLPACPLREFEELSGRLKGLLAEPTPNAGTIDDVLAPEPTAPPPQQKRAARLADGGLIAVARDRAVLPASDNVDVTSTVGFSEVLVFRSSEYRKHVASELWQRMDIAFWKAVQRWLTEFAEQSTGFSPHLRQGVATGLAVLAAVAPAEVQEGYLEPWSKHTSLLRTQTMAGWVLMAMSVTDELSVTALRIAQRWGSSDAWRQQWAATLACSGELGEQYPYEATVCLIRLLTDGAKALREFPGDALGALFGQLAHRPLVAGPVLQQLAAQLPGSDIDPRRRKRVLTAVLLVLSARQPHTGHSATLAVIGADAEYVASAAQLWAAVLRYRPLRARAIDALTITLSYPVAPRRQPDGRHVAFVEALAEELPELERRSLRHELIVRHRRKNPAGIVESPIQILTDQLGAPSSAGVNT